jgi:endonuclease III related protein
MSSFSDAFDSVRTSLLRQFGPAKDEFESLEPFEAMVAVVLDRHLRAGRWRAAFDGLIDGDLVEPDRLANADILEIADAIKARGVTATSVEIAPLKRLGRWVVDHGDTNGFANNGNGVGSNLVPPAWLREELAAIKGIGPTAADAIVLFALKRPGYPVDRATFRVLVRHGWLDPTATYDEARDLMVERAESALGEQEQPVVTALADLSQGMELIGRRFCRAAEAHCVGCPLQHLLPEGGPREIDA